MASLGLFMRMTKTLTLRRSTSLAWVPYKINWESTNKEAFRGLYGCGKVSDLGSINTRLIIADVGQQGLVHVKEDTPYMKMVEAFIAKKKVCRVPNSSR